MIKVAHVLYSGLGGHKGAVMDLNLSAHSTNIEEQYFFYGKEPLLAEYKELVTDRKSVYNYVKKSSSLDLLSSIKIAAAVLNSDCEIAFIHSSNLVPFFLVYNIWKRKKITFVEHTSPNVKTKAELLYSLLGYYGFSKKVCLYEDFANELSNRLPLKLQRSKYTLIRNGVEILPQPMIRSFDFTSSIKFGFAGRLTKVKRLDLVLDLLAQLAIGTDQQLLLQIAGNGDAYYTQALKQKVKKIEEFVPNLKVEFLGQLDRDHLTKFYKEIDGFVQMSESESSPIAILEAVNLGCFILASDIEAHREIFGVELQKFLIPLNFETSEVAVIGQLIKNSENIKSFNSMLRDGVIQKFSLDQTRESYFTLIDLIK